MEGGRFHGAGAAPFLSVAHSRLLMHRDNATTLRSHVVFNGRDGTRSDIDALEVSHRLIPGLAFARNRSRVFLFGTRASLATAETGGVIGNIAILAAHGRGNMVMVVMRLRGRGERDTLPALDD